MRVAITGVGGLIGSALRRFLADRGDEVLRLVRQTTPVAADELGWDPLGGQLDAARLEGVDAVVHLAGDSLAHGRWTSEKKRRIRESRVAGTRLLGERLAQLNRPPSVLLSASAVGFSGDRGAKVLAEESGAGTGFLAEVCQAWEGATEMAEQRGIRVVHLRFGLVLSGDGGALLRLLPLFRWGLGGRLGDGRQYVSWVDLEDVVGAIELCLRNGHLRGPVNVVSPQPVTNAEFTEALARAVGRRAFLPVPAVVLAAVLGEMARETLLSSARVDPARLKAAGFGFRHPQLEGSLAGIVLRSGGK